MSEAPPARSYEMNEREHRWLTALLVLGTVAVGFVVTSFVAGYLLFFGDIIMVFFLAWLLAFIIGPVSGLLVRVIPKLPQAVAVILVYLSLLAILVLIALAIAQALYSSINTLVQHWPTPDQLPGILQPWQDRLDSIGLGQIRLTDQAVTALQNLKSGAAGLVEPLKNLAFASLGVMGNLLIVLILSLYMAIDRDRILSFLFRLVPPSYAEEARLFETSISRSFGGFLRGQALMGVIYAFVAAFTSTVLGLDYLPVTTAASGVLQAIPFFGPFISWAPPVLVAIFFKPSAIIPALLMMGIGWFLVMNIIQPRIMADAVGLHPIVVLGSVLIGSKLAGIGGAIFGIPIAAVMSSFFFYYLGHRSVETGTVAVRAARRLEAREGRRVRIPREPQPGEDEEVEEARPVQARRVRTAEAPGDAMLDAAVTGEAIGEAETASAAEPLLASAAEPRSAPEPRPVVEPRPASIVEPRPAAEPPPAVRERPAPGQS